MVLSGDSCPMMAGMPARITSVACGRVTLPQKGDGLGMAGYPGLTFGCESSPVNSDTTRGPNRVSPGSGDGIRPATSVVVVLVPGLSDHGQHIGLEAPIQETLGGTNSGCDAQRGMEWTASPVN